MSYSFAHLAYLKPLLHAAKYPASAVNGIFVSSAGNDKTVVNAIPLFHFWNMLSPMLEVAMTQIESYCQDNGLQIAGYYEANEQINDRTLSTVGQKIASQIRNVNQDAIAVVVDNTKITSGQNAFLVSQFKDGQWRSVGSAELANSGSPALVKKAIADGSASKLVDFDNHLENATADWLANSAL